MEPKCGGGFYLTKKPPQCLRLLEAASRNAFERRGHHRRATARFYRYLRYLKRADSRKYGGRRQVAPTPHCASLSLQPRRGENPSDNGAPRAARRVRPYSAKQGDRLPE